MKYPDTNKTSHDTSSPERKARCERCGQEIAARVVAERVGEPAEPQNDDTGKPFTTLDVIKYMWGGGPTWRQYMIAGEQTIRLI